MRRTPIVTEYARMWPREVFDIFKGNKLLISELPEMKSPGVYILYRDEMPYYIGKARHKLFSRLHSHANLSTDPYFNFWNYFSFFVVPDAGHVGEVEGILIASTPTANIAVPKMKRVKLPSSFARVLRPARKQVVER